MAASPLLQAAALAAGSFQGWAVHGESTLTAQGRASGSAVVLFARFVLPHYSGLVERLAEPGARMLDVGTGIGALAIGCAQAFPQVHVTGIDVLARVLDIARSHVRASPVASRIELRQQNVAELTETARYDLAWIPAPFVPEPAFSAGVARMVAALRPGGVLMVGHGSFDGSELQIAITRFKTIATGGTPLDGPTATRLLDKLGLSCVQTVPTPPGAPRITAGRRPDI
jgi:methylase of polypeptide subunit release factors